MINLYPEYCPKQIIEVLGKEDGEWYNNGCKIPYKSTSVEHERYHAVNSAVEQAAKEGRLVDISNNKPDYKLPRVMLITDQMDDVVNPADGKMYDSRSSYYRAVKDKGLEIVGDDAPSTPSKPKTKEIDWERAVSESLKTTPKGK